MSSTEVKSNRLKSWSKKVFRKDSKRNKFFQKKSDTKNKENHDKSNISSDDLENSVKLSQLAGTSALQEVNKELTKNENLVQLDNSSNSANESSDLIDLNEENNDNVVLSKNNKSLLSGYSDSIEYIDEHVYDNLLFRKNPNPQSSLQENCNRISERTNIDEYNISKQINGPISNDQGNDKHISKYNSKLNKCPDSSSDSHIRNDKQSLNSEIMYTPTNKINEISIQNTSNESNAEVEFQTSTPIYTPSKYKFEYKKPTININPMYNYKESLENLDTSLTSVINELKSIAYPITKSNYKTSGKFDLLKSSQTKSSNDENILFINEEIEPLNNENIDCKYTTIIPIYANYTTINNEETKSIDEKNINSDDIDIKTLENNDLIVIDKEIGTISENISSKNSYGEKSMQSMVETKPLLNDNTFSLDVVSTEAQAKETSLINTKSINIEDKSCPRTKTEQTKSSTPQPINTESKLIREENEDFISLTSPPENKDQSSRTENRLPNDDSLLSNNLLSNKPLAVDTISSTNLENKSSAEVTFSLSTIDNLESINGSGSTTSNIETNILDSKRISPNLYNGTETDQDESLIKACPLNSEDSIWLSTNARPDHSESLSSFKTQTEPLNIECKSTINLETEDKIIEPITIKEENNKSPSISSKSVMIGKNRNAEENKQNIIGDRTSTEALRLNEQDNNSAHTENVLNISKSGTKQIIDEVESETARSDVKDKDFPFTKIQSVIDENQIKTESIVLISENKQQETDIMSEINSDAPKLVTENTESVTDMDMCSTTEFMNLKVEESISVISKSKVVNNEHASANNTHSECLNSENPLKSNKEVRSLEIESDIVPNSDVIIFHTAQSKSLNETIKSSNSENTFDVNFKNKPLDSECTKSANSLIEILKVDDATTNNTSISELTEECTTSINKDTEMLGVKQTTLNNADEKDIILSDVNNDEIKITENEELHNKNTETVSNFVEGTVETDRISENLDSSDKCGVVKDININSTSVMEESESLTVTDTDNESLNNEDLPLTSSENELLKIEFNHNANLNPFEDEETPDKVTEETFCVDNTKETEKSNESFSNMSSDHKISKIEPTVNNTINIEEASTITENNPFDVEENSSNDTDIENLNIENTPFDDQSTDESKAEQTCSNSTTHETIKEEKTNYPVDLNPFGDEEINDNGHISYPNELNPFDSSDDEEITRIISNASGKEIKLSSAPTPPLPKQQTSSECLATNISYSQTTNGDNQSYSSEASKKITNELPDICSKNPFDEDCEEIQEEKEVKSSNPFDEDLEDSQNSEITVVRPKRKPKNSPTKGCRNESVMTTSTENLKTNSPKANHNSTLPKRSALGNRKEFYGSTNTFELNKRFEGKMTSTLSLNTSYDSAMKDFATFDRSRYQSTNENINTGGFQRNGVNASLPNHLYRKKKRKAPLPPSPQGPRSNYTIQEDQDYPIKPPSRRSSVSSVRRTPPPRPPPPKVL